MSIHRLTASLMALLIVSAFLIDLSTAPLQAQGNTPPAAITEYQLPTPNSNPGGIVVGSDQAVWFIESVANKIGRITTDGNLSEFRIPQQQP